MKTDDLINALATDLPAKQERVETALWRAIAISLPVSVLILLLALHIRADLWAMLLSSPRVLFKFVFTGLTLALTIWSVRELSRPTATARSIARTLAVAIVLLASAVCAELYALPQSAWKAAWMGDAAMVCMAMIPLLSLAPLIAILLALQAGAPHSPWLAGAAGGLLAGTIGAALYATHCTNDSPLFVASWYALAIAAVTAAGGLIGGRLLRW